jgi:hypothetical protein
MIDHGYAICDAIRPASHDHRRGRQRDSSAAGGGGGIGGIGSYRKRSRRKPADGRPIMKEVNHVHCHLANGVRTIVYLAHAHSSP